MYDLLYLVHRIPYPPNKGDKIRSYHILEHLSRRFRVHLGTFIDDDNDCQYVEQVNSLCTSSHILPLRPGYAKLASLCGLLSGEPLSIRYYRNRSMQTWVNQAIGKYAIKKVLVFSSAMAQFVPASMEGLKVIDFVDVDSDKWRQYACGKHWPLSWIYEREGRNLLKYDRSIAENFDRCFFVSEAESALFKNLASESRDRIYYFNNGVDTEYFSPDREYRNPYGHEGPVLVFTGAMDYWANVDAVAWFARSVFPLIRTTVPDVRFYIVGSRPTNPVKALDKVAGINVTGRVEDIRPYLFHATLSVAPLRIARGVQNKVLEAMAMNKPVLATTPAMEGIPLSDSVEITVADDPQGFADQAVRILKERDHKSNRRTNTDFVVMHYSWSSNLEILDTFLLS